MPPPDTDAPRTLRNTFESAARGRYTMPIVLTLGLVGMAVNESTYQHSHTTLTNGIALTDARVKSAETLQLITEVGLYARSYILTADPSESEEYRAAVGRMQALKKSAFDLVAKVDAGRTISVAAIDRLIDEQVASSDEWVAMVSRGERAPAMAAAASGASLARRDALREEFDQVLRKAAAIQQVARFNLYEALQINRLAVHLLALATVAGLFLFQRQLRQGDRQMAQEGLRLAARVKERTAELTEMAAHLVKAREDERAHVARELHDEMGGLLTSMKLDFARLKRLGDLPEKAGERILALEGRLNEGIALKRRIIEDLRPSALTQLGLEQALEILCRDMSERLGQPVHTHFDAVTLDPAAELTLYRITQESLTNIGKYAHSRSVTVRLEALGPGVRLTVHDDGNGFCLEQVPHGRHGLRGMRVRVESHGGELGVRSQPGSGTSIVAFLPASQTAA